MCKDLKHCLFGLLVLVMYLPARAEDRPRDWFAKGNEQYAKARYEQALQAYQKVEQSGYSSAVFNFNLGNTYYKLGNMPAAILNYERAYKLAPADQDIDLNLKLARLKITDKIEEIPELFLRTWWKNFLFFLSLSQLSVWSIVLFITGFLLLTFYLFARSRILKKTAFFSGLTLTFTGLVFVLLAAAQSSYFNSHRQAIVFNSSVEVKNGPGSALKTLFVIHQGTKVNLLEDQQNWVKIELANGNTGWIDASVIQRI